MILKKYDHIGFSIGAHIVIFVIMAVGLPHIQRDLKIDVDEVGVEIAFDNDIKPEPVIAPEAEPKPILDTPPPPPPSPPPTPEPEPIPKPEITPEPEAEAVPSVAPIPQLKPEPKPKPKPKPEPKPKPKKLPNMVKAKLPKNILKQLSNNKPKPKPKQKKKEKPKQNRLDSLLKTVEKIDQKPIVKTDKEDKKEEKNDKLANIAQLLKQQQTQQQKSSLNIGGLNNSEMNALRGQIASCWNIQAGAREADKLVVEVLITVDRDKKVRDVRLVGQQFPNDRFWLTAAESAVRAFLNDRCKTLKLPDGKYETWQEIRFKFDPKQMFG